MAQQRHNSVPIWNTHGCYGSNAKNRISQLESEIAELEAQQDAAFADLIELERVAREINNRLITIRALQDRNGTKRTRRAKSDEE